MWLGLHPVEGLWDVGWLLAAKGVETLGCILCCFLVVQKIMGVMIIEGGDGYGGIECMLHSRHEVWLGEGVLQVQFVLFPSCGGVDATGTESDVKCRVDVVT